MTTTEQVAEVLADHAGWKPSRQELGAVRCACGVEYPAGDIYLHQAATLAAAGLLID